MARVYKRGGKWWIDFQAGGRRTRKAAQGALTKAQAEDFLSLQKKDAIDERIYGPKPKRDSMSFADFANHFLRTDSPGKKSKERDKGILEMLKEAWKGKALSEVTPEDIAEYRARRREKAARGAATVNKELQVIGRLFKKAVDWGRIPASPAAKVDRLPTPPGRVRYLEFGEMDRLMKALADWLAPIVLFARHTGARRSEIFNLEWRDVDFRRGLILFRDTKNGENGAVEMSQTARALLKFREPEGEYDKAARVFEPVKWMKLRRAWERACKKAKIADFRFHDLRHQAATDLLTRGADLNDVRDFLRHKSMNMTLRYAHLVRARRQRTAALLDLPAPDVEHGTKTGTADPPGAVSPESPSSSLA